PWPPAQDFTGRLRGASIVSLASALLAPLDEEGAMAKRRKPTPQPPAATFVTETALDAGVRAVEMTAAVARGLAKSALAAARAMSESFAQAAEETTRAAAGPAASPRRRTSKKTQNRRRRAA